MTLQARLVVASRKKLIGPAAYAALKLLGVEFPRSVEFDSPPVLPHGAPGLVVHERTRMGCRVKLYQGVTIGRSDVWDDDGESAGRVVLQDDVTLGAGAVVLFHTGQVLTIGRGAVIGANAVVTKSVGAMEIWAGNPARRVRVRTRDGA